MAFKRKRKFKDFVGYEDKNIKVLGYLRTEETKYRSLFFWECLCKICDSLFEAHSGQIRMKDSDSHGCGSSIGLNATHGESRHGNRSVLYMRWAGMKSRCFTSTSSGYERYGDKGITVCAEWLGENGYENFKAWALANGFREDLTLDRRAPRGNYEPSNCRWITYAEQARNYDSRNVWVDIEGETLCLTDAWAKYGNGISKTGLRYRKEKLGWDWVKAITTPVTPKKGNTYAKKSPLG